MEKEEEEKGRGGVTRRGFSSHKGRTPQPLGRLLALVVAVAAEEADEVSWWGSDIVEDMIVHT